MPARHSVGSSIASFVPFLCCPVSSHVFCVVVPVRFVPGRALLPAALISACQATVLLIGLFCRECHAAYCAFLFLHLLSFQHAA